MKSFIQEFVEQAGNQETDKLSLDKLKLKIAKKHKLAKIPSYNEIFLNLDSVQTSKLSWVVNKPTRTISGVAPISIMSKPSNCPSQAKCTYCPGGINSPFGNTPKSYTGNEPASRRAARNDYDPYFQVMNRLEQYILNNHPPEKVELIIQGGTFPAFSQKYQQEFIAYAFKAMNDFSSIFYNHEFNMAKFKEFFSLPHSTKNIEQVEIIKSKLFSIKGKANLEFEKKRNEDSKIKCIGLTIETRPDYGMLKHGKSMLALGATRVELGIQSVYDHVLTKVRRGHPTMASKKSMKILKDLGFKINAHYMLGLPLTDGKEDLAGLNHLFSNQDYRPDMLKIYPCLVMQGTELFEDYKQGNFTPMSTEQAASIIAEFKKDIPEYCRIMRIQRDIPTNVTEAGVDRTNLRQYVEKIMKARNYKCRCIRCREAGRHLEVTHKTLKTLQYESSDGKEFFISIVDGKQDVLLGFCRLRFPSQYLTSEITKQSAIIRELHVYGKLARLGFPGKIQHKGLGLILLKEAEKIALQNAKNKMVIISGIGVRNYYRKFGYNLEGPYMSKQLS